MAGSDIKTKRITSTGSLGVGPTRIRQIHVKTGSGHPRLTVTDGSGGATVLDLDFADATADTHSVNIPAEGIRVTDIFVGTLTAISAVTFFFN